MSRANDRQILAVVVVCLTVFAVPGYAASDEAGGTETNTVAGTGLTLPTSWNREGALSRLPAESFQDPSQMSSDWQVRYNRALEKRGAAHVKDWLGLAMMGGGIVLANVSVGNTATCVRFLDCSDSSALGQMYAALGLVSGGAVVSIWGLVEGSSANSELALLEQERLRAGRGSSMRLPIGDRSTLVIGVAQKAAHLSYAVGW